MQLKTQCNSSVVIPDMLHMMKASVNIEVLGKTNKKTNEATTISGIIKIILCQV